MKKLLIAVGFLAALPLAAGISEAQWESVR